MFSFHRPKVYRSSTGCCICKAKSSSSRFTDSKKYEEDFLECFKLSTPRQGEICNACVLLVKRWKKLPAGSDRNWQHVVDARAGPGIKSITKFKVKNKKHNSDEKPTEKIKAKKTNFVREDSPNLSDKSEEAEFNDDFMLEDGPSGGSSRAASPGASDNEEVVEKNRRYKGGVKHRSNVDHVTDFVDPEYWKREVICCGIIFRGMYNEIMLDPRCIKPCTNRLANCKIRAKMEISNAVVDAIENVSTKLYSDSSSDSGYDESSNQGVVASEAAIFQKGTVGIEEVKSQIPQAN